MNINMIKIKDKNSLIPLWTLFLKKNLAIINMIIYLERLELIQEIL